MAYLSVEIECSSGIPIPAMIFGIAASDPCPWTANSSSPFDAVEAQRRAIQMAAAAWQDLGDLTLMSCTLHGNTAVVVLRAADGSTITASPEMAAEGTSGPITVAIPNRHRRTRLTLSELTYNAIGCQLDPNPAPRLCRIRAGPAEASVGGRIRALGQRRGSRQAPCSFVARCRTRLLFGGRQRRRRPMPTRGRRACLRRGFAPPVHTRR